MVENINFGKPHAVYLICPRCDESNALSILTIGDIRGRKMICKGCAREFKAFVHWEPRTWTEKDFNDGTEKTCYVADSVLNLGAGYNKRIG